MIIKARAEISKRENGKTIQKIIEIKNWVFEKTKDIATLTTKNKKDKNSQNQK